MVNLLIKPVKSGLGVVSDSLINEGETILKFGGKYYTYSELPAPYNSVDDHYMQINKDLYIGPSGEIDDYLNHSCDPNSAVKINGKDVLLFAIKKIEPGEEITWDYSTTMDEDDWELDCECGTSNCRKKIKDFKYLPSELQEKYFKLNSLPDYILESVKKECLKND